MKKERSKNINLKLQPIKVIVFQTCSMYFQKFSKDLYSGIKLGFTQIC